MLSHLPDDAVQLHSLPEGALCSVDVSQLLPEKGVVAHPQKKRSIRSSVPWSLGNK